MQYWPAIRHRYVSVGKVMIPETCKNLSQTFDQSPSSLHMKISY